MNGLNGVMQTIIICPNCNHEFDVNDARFPVPVGMDDHAKDKHVPALSDSEPRGTSVADVAMFLFHVGFAQAEAEYGDTSLHVAARSANVEIVKYLIVTDGAKVNVKNNARFTPLHWAALRNNDVEVVKYLVSMGASVHAKDKDGSTPLHFASRNNVNVEVAQFFVSVGADVNAEDQYGLTPLLLAAGWNGNIAVVRFLVSEGADVNAIDGSGRTSLDHAKGNRAKIRYLKSVGAKSGK